MKLVLIYGQPATGKLTVAKELSKLTGYKIFHNHLTADLASSIFPFGTKEYSDLVAKIRLDSIETAAKNKVKGLLFTFAYGVETYGGKTDDSFVRQVVAKVRKYNGKVVLIKIVCEEKELRRRLTHPSRKTFNKLSSIKVLQSIRKKFDLNAVLPFGETHIIDNTKLSVKKTALMIKKLCN